MRNERCLMAGERWNTGFSAAINLLLCVRVSGEGPAVSNNLCCVCAYP